MIVVHHLNNSRSQRVLWLLEELEIRYEIVRYPRAGGHRQRLGQPYRIPMGSGETEAVFCSWMRGEMDRCLME